MFKAQQKPLEQHFNVLLYSIYHHYSPTLHIEQLVLGGDLGGALGHGLAVEDSLQLLSGALQDKALGGVISHHGGVVCDLLCRDFSVQGHLGQRVSHTTGHHSSSVWAQVHDLKVDG